MLVLSRQRDETIMIGDDVEITVVDIRGDKVRLGITAPRHVQVHRKEVYDAIKRENQQASGLSPGDVPPNPDREGGSGRGGAGPRPGNGDNDSNRSNGSSDAR
jgi:carbon storage regulator